MGEVSRPGLAIHPSILVVQGKEMKIEEENEAHTTVHTCILLPGQLEQRRSLLPSSSPAALFWSAPPNHPSKQAEETALLYLYVNGKERKRPSSIHHNCLFLYLLLFLDLLRLSFTLHTSRTISPFLLLRQAVKRGRRRHQSKLKTTMKPMSGEAEVEVLVDRPYSHERLSSPPRPPPPTTTTPRPPPPPLRARPYYRRWSPWIVSAAAVACVVAFVVTMYVNDCPGHRGSTGGCAAGFLGRFAFQPLKENPLLGPSSDTLRKMGGLDVSKVVHGRQGWRLITCMWLHAGVVHLLVNMLCLLFIGIRLEQEFGFVRIGLVYLISGFGGSLMSALFIQSGISVGASGALFGLIGSMLSELITNWSLYANKVAALLTLIFVIVVNLALGLLPIVDNFAHIGGLISGFLLGFVFFIRPQSAWLNQRRESADQQIATSPVKRKHKTYQYILWLAAAVFLIVGFTVAIVLLFRGYNANDHCSWCQYLSCVPTKRWKCNSSPTICTAMQRENTLDLTCEGRGINRSYLIANATQAKINELCNQLCS